MIYFERISKRIKNLAADIINYEVSDPRVKLSTVTKVKLSKDYKYCKIYVSILGTEEKQRACMHGLEHARGYIQSLIASRLSMRRVPLISFEYDESIERSIRISKLIDDAIKQDGTNKDDAIEQDGANKDEAIEQDGANKDEAIKQDGANKDEAIKQDMPEKPQIDSPSETPE